ncbi:MAG TPA: hypothetical protein VJT72_13375 [Pseudonocardiaceae bacterium]|nr:hypothetical protein [Pseudonocardiaceae bacterium]
MAGVISDDAARFAHLAEGNARQARKRIAADVLVRDEAGRVLLLAARMRPDIWRRLQRAHTALRTGATDYHERTS